MMIGLKVLERLRTSWQDGRTQLQSLLNASAENTPSTRMNDPNGQSNWPPSLESLLEQAGDLSPFSTALGVCQDGLPFLLDLTNPAPGALLIASDRQGGKTRLMRSILTAAAKMNHAEQVIFYVLATEPQEYELFSTLDHCQGILPTHGTGSGQLIQELVDLAETRRRSQSESPFIILAIDDLADCLQAINEQDFARLYRLIHHGPRSYIWPIVTLCAEEAVNIHPRLLSIFRTRLIGFIHDDEQAALVSQDERLDARWIEEGQQFYVPYGEEWLPLWICDPSDEGLNDQVNDEPPEHEPLEESLPILFVESDALRELRAWNERLGVEQAVVEPIKPTPHSAAQGEHIPGQTTRLHPVSSVPRSSSESETTRFERQNTHFPVDPGRGRSQASAPNTPYPQRTPRLQDDTPAMHREKPLRPGSGSGKNLDYREDEDHEDLHTHEHRPVYPAGPFSQADPVDARETHHGDLDNDESLEEMIGDDFEQDPGQVFDYEYVDEEDLDSTTTADDHRQGGRGNGHDPGGDRNPGYD